MLIGYSQTAGDARIFAARHRYRIDVNQESVAQGSRKPRCRPLPGHAGLDQPVGELVERHFRSPHAVASIVTGLTVLATLLLIAPAVLPPTQGRPRRRDHRRRRVRDDGPSRDEAHVAVKRSTSGSLWLPSSPSCRWGSGGVLIGIGLSTLWLVYVSTHPDHRARPATGLHRVPAARPTSGETFPGMLVLGFIGGLLFATADACEDRIRPAALVIETRSRRGHRLRRSELRRLTGRGDVQRDRHARVAKRHEGRIARVRRRCSWCSKRRASSTDSVLITSTPTSTRQLR